MDVKEYRKLAKTTINKYGAKPVEYNGVKYHSTKEATYAKQLDLGICVGTIKEWQRQVRYVLGFNDVAITTYVLDFKVWYVNGDIEHVDVKGMRKGAAYNMFTIKKKLMRAILGIEIIEV